MNLELRRGEELSENALPVVSSLRVDMLGKEEESRATLEQVSRAMWLLVGTRVFGVSRCGMSL